MLVRVLLEIEADEVDPKRPETVQVRDLENVILHRCGQLPKPPAGAPLLRKVGVLQTIVISSARHVTPMEIAVAAVADDTTRRIVVSEEPEQMVAPKDKPPLDK